MTITLPDPAWLALDPAPGLGSREPLATRCKSPAIEGSFERSSCGLIAEAEPPLDRLSRPRAVVRDRDKALSGV
jgi:hypothetical protein